MPLPVVTVASGGMPVVETTNGLGVPVIEAVNGRGRAVTKVALPKGGMPVIFASGAGIASVVYGDFQLPTTNANNWADLTVVILIPAATLSSAAGATKLSVTTEFKTFLASGTLSGYVGQRAASGDAYDFAGTPAQLKWGGNANLAGDGTTLIFTSDFVTLPQAFDNTKDYLFAFYSGPFSNAHIASGDRVAGENLWYASGNVAAAVDKSGLTLGLTDTSVFIRKIQVQP